MTDDSLFSGREANERLAAAVTPYGVQTRSYNRSPEKREVDRQRAAATAAWERLPRPEVIVGPICTCRSFRFPHELKEHDRLFSDHDWAPWQKRRYREVWREKVS